MTTEVRGDLVHVVHVDSSGNRQLLALCTRDGIEVSTDEDENDVSLGAERRSRRYRTHNAPTLDVESLIAVDTSAAERVGLVNADGSLSFDNADRRLEDGSILIEYYDGEDDVGQEFGHRFDDVEAIDVEIDAGNNPPILSWSWAIHGPMWLRYLELIVESDESYTVESGETEDYHTATVHGTLTVESGATLNITG